MATSADTLTVQVDLPWSTHGDTAPDVAVVGKELRLLWLIEQVRMHKLSVGKAAELSGLPRAGFMQVLGAHGVPVIDYAATDLEQELQRSGLT